MSGEPRDERRVVWQTRISSVELGGLEADEFGFDYGDVFVRFVRLVRANGGRRVLLQSSLPVREGGEQPTEPGDYDEMSMLEAAEEDALGVLLDEFEAMKRVVDVAELLIDEGKGDYGRAVALASRLNAAVDELRAHRARKAG